MSFRGIILLLACLAATRAEESPPHAETTEPPQNNNARRTWLDDTHEWTTEALCRRVAWIDSMFYSPETPRRGDPRSRFRVKVYAETDLENPGTPVFRDEFFANVRLPGLSQRFRLVLDSQRLEQFPGEGAEDQERSPRVALRRAGSWLDADIGAKLGNPPRAFTRFTARKSWNTQLVEWHARQRFFYDTNEGFGEVTSLSQHCWLGRHFMLGHSTSARWSESTTGLEWQEALGLSRILGLVEDEKHGQFVGQSDMAHGLSLLLRVNGHHNGSHQMDKYRAGLYYRRPLFRRNFLFLEIAPEVEWNGENNWDPVYTLKAGVDILFWRDL